MKQIGPNEEEDGLHWRHYAIITETNVAFNSNSITEFQSNNTVLFNCFSNIISTICLKLLYF